MPIDSIRVISNVSSGRTGISLAEEADRRGASVTLMLGPVGDIKTRNGIKLLRFRFFDELKKILNRQLSGKRFDIIIHLAAVSDFKVAGAIKGKIPSGRRMALKLEPAEKLSDIIRKKAKGALLVIFKLEAGVSSRELVKRARAAMERCSADMVVANMFRGLRYAAFIISGEKIYTVNRREGMAKILFKAIEQVRE